MLFHYFVELNCLVTWLTRSDFFVCIPLYIVLCKCDRQSCNFIQPLKPAPKTIARLCQCSTEINWQSQREVSRLLTDLCFEIPVTLALLWDPRQTDHLAGINLTVLYKYHLYVEQNTISKPLNFEHIFCLRNNINIISFYPSLFLW